MGDDTHMGSSSTEETFNVEESESEAEHEPEPKKPEWIPGFTYESVFIGLALVGVILWSTRAEK